MMLRRDFFQQGDPVERARALIGCHLSVNGCLGKIVETEAYTALGDTACHAFSRRSIREFLEKHPPGTAYVYLNYGIHWMLNVLVKHPTGNGFVLIRAVEPLQNLEQMAARRNQPVTALRNLCSGPGKLGSAFGITGDMNGSDLCKHRDFCFLAPPIPPSEILADRRVGITKSADLPWRFLEKDSPFVSVPFGKA